MGACQSRKNDITLISRDYGIVTTVVSSRTQSFIGNEEPQRLQAPRRMFSSIPSISSTETLSSLCKQKTHFLHPSAISPSPPTPRSFSSSLQPPSPIVSQTYSSCTNDEDDGDSSSLSSKTSSFHNNNNNNIQRLSNPQKVIFQKEYQKRKRFSLPSNWSLAMCYEASTVLEDPSSRI